MDQRERIGNQEEALRAMMDGRLANVWTALPGIIENFDAAKMTAQIQAAIRIRFQDKDGNYSWKEIPLLLDCPIVFPCAGDFALTLPVKQGDEVLVVFSSRCIDQWWQSGEVGNQAELRLHSLSDGFAIPGPSSVPKALPAISTTSAQLRTRDGSAYIELAPGGVINIVAPGGVNINGATAITGDVDVTGKVTATDEGTFNGGHTVSQHKHGGVQAGGSQTATPTG
jgi:hypothetical protein